MSKKLKTLIIALGALFLLAGGYYWSTIRQSKKESSSSYTPSPKLGNLESSELVKIELPGIVLEKSDEVWKLTYLEGGIPPSGIELDQRQIQVMTYSLASVWVDRIVDEAPADLSAYGLDKGASKTTVTDSSGNKAEYFLGDMTPSRTGYYVMEEGDPKVYTVSAYTAGALRFTLNSIRRRNLFQGIELANLTHLRLERPGGRIELRNKQ